MTKTLNIKVALAAQLLQKSEQFVRIGLQRGCRLAWLSKIMADIVTISALLNFVTTWA